MTQHNENQGRDQYIINQPGAVSIHERERPTRSRSESLLLQTVKQEVIDRLNQSLHNAVFINLGKQSQPQQVKRPWDAEIKIGSQLPKPLPTETTILEVFDRPDIAGRLLILGEPGAGKTTTMLDLAKGLCDRAEQDSTAFIPILLNLSSWKDPKQTMTAWLVEELKSKYGVRKDIGTKWLAEKQLLPLLDGLDEVKPEHQESCVQAINRWLESEDSLPSLAVCCRREEYEKVVRGSWQAEADEQPDETRMHLNGAILLRTLTDEQIQAYLIAANQPELWQMLRQDEALWDLIRTPLWLSITLLSYAGLSLNQWQQTTSTKQRLSLLLDAYVQKMLHREIKTRAYQKRKPPAPKQTRQWLEFLATQLERDSQTEFLIEKMQPFWLRTNRQRRTYQLIFGLTYGSIAGPIAGLFLGLFSGSIVELFGGLFGGLIVGLFLGPIAGLIVGLFLVLISRLNGITTVEAIQISMSPDARREMLQQLRVGLSLGLFLGLIFGLSVGLSVRPIAGLIVGLISGLIIVLISVLILGLKADIETRIRPNQGIWNSAQNMAMLLILAVLFTIAMFFFLPLLLSAFLQEREITVIMTWVLTVPALITFLLGGGQACIQHVSLRFVLFRSGSIPWNYARFLDYCTDRLLLQRVGGRYRFIHKSLQEHFARMGE